MRINHVGVLVADLEAAKTFARDVLGLGDPAAEFDVVDEHGLAGAFFTMGDGMLEVFTITDGGRAPDGEATLDHIAVTVDDLEAEQERLAAKGVRFTGPTQPDEITEPFELRGGLHLWTVPETSAGVRYQLVQAPR